MILKTNLLITCALLLCGAMLTAACTDPASAQEDADIAAPVTPDAGPPLSPDQNGKSDTGDESDICPGGEVSPAQAWALLQSGRSDITMIDIRREHEYEAEHVPGSVHIGIMEDDFLARLRELPRDGTYLIICWHGNTSRGTVHNMENEGFSSACSVQGGYELWRALNMPLER